MTCWRRIDADQRFGDVEPAELIGLVRASIKDMLTPLGRRTAPVSEPATMTT
jgi:hypothetical protein